MFSESLKPVGWFPQSLSTKVNFGFRRNSQIEDGSPTSLSLINELATLPGPLKEKMYALYASGVDGFEGKTFSPKQLAAMVVYRNPYKPGDICHWIGGIRTDEGIVYGPRFPKKQQLFESLCDTLDNWNPQSLKSLDVAISHRIRQDLDSFNVSHQRFSDKELNTFLVANYAQFIYLLIHPFWNRNGRSSEELMILFSSSNSTKEHVFYEQSQRLTQSSASRMDLVNQLALETLKNIFGELGTEVDAKCAETEGYNTMLRKENNPSQKIALSLLGPYLYRFISPFIKSDSLDSYFDHLEARIDYMIQSLTPDNISRLVADPQAIKLLAHHLTQGHRPGSSSI